MNNSVNSGARHQEVSIIEEVGAMLRRDARVKRPGS